MSNLLIFGQSAIRTAPIEDTIRALLIPAVIAVGLFVVMLAVRKRITEAIIIGVIAVIGLGIAALATDTAGLGGAVAGWLRSVLPG